MRDCLIMMKQKTDVKRKRNISKMKYFAEYVTDHRSP